LIIYENNIRVKLDDAKLLTTSKIEIVDTRTNKKYFANGELYPTSSHIFFAQAYFFEKNIDNAIFYDGELDQCERQLDRKIALADIAALKETVEPITIFQHKKKLKKQKIDLDNSAPSLDWFREFSARDQIKSI